MYIYKLLSKCIKSKIMFFIKQSSSKHREGGKDHKTLLGPLIEARDCSGIPILKKWSCRKGRNCPQLGTRPGTHYLVDTFPSALRNL